MKISNNTKIFIGSILIGMVVALIYFYYAGMQGKVMRRVHRLTNDISIADQLNADDIGALKSSGIATIIDVRPDREVADRQVSTAMAGYVQDNQMKFLYVPIIRDDISGPTVESLASAIASSPKPVLIYCRIGRRAARTWALVEASRAGGLTTDSILSEIKASGLDADDLKSVIDGRIANRPVFNEGRK